MGAPDEEYENFYRHYQPFIRAFVQRRVAASDIDDLVAETFSIAWRRRDAVPADALAWLYRTARNVIGTRYRANARLSALREKLTLIPIEPAADPAEVLSSRERLFAAFVELSDDDRELLLFVAWEGLENDEIAEVLEISSGACAVRLHRARSRFDSALAASMADHVVADDREPAGRAPGASPPPRDITNTRPDVARPGVIQRRKDPR